MNFRIAFFLLCLVSTGCSQNSCEGMVTSLFDTIGCTYNSNSWNLEKCSEDFNPAWFYETRNVVLEAKDSKQYHLFQSKFHSSRCSKIADVENLLNTRPFKQIEKENWGTNGKLAFSVSFEEFEYFVVFDDKTEKLIIAYSDKEYMD